MKRFSLIVATLGRTKELERLLDSLAAQEYWDYELIVVDQNADERLAPMLSRWREEMAEDSQGQFAPAQLLHLRCEPGLSKARNYALAVCTGQIVAFPDDDCWYPAGTLSKVDHWFRQHDEFQLLSLTARDEDGVRSGNRWHAAICDIRAINIFRTSASYTFFARRSDVRERLRFDEKLGIGSGTRFGSGEDTDFMLRFLKGRRGCFLSKWHVGHPRKDMLGGHMTVDRSFSYGQGMGRVLGKHSLFPLWLALMGYDYARAILLVALRRKTPAALYFAHAKGIWSSYFAIEA